MRTVFTFEEKLYPPVKSVKIVNAECLPNDFADRIWSMLERKYKGELTGLAVLTAVRSEVENWYLARGYTYSNIRDLGGLETGHLTLKVFEPKVRNVVVKFVDDEMQEVASSTTVTPTRVREVVSMKRGQFYSATDGRAALQEAFTLNVRTSPPPARAAW